MLQTTFIPLVQKYTEDNFYIERLWKEIERSYSSKKRYYHNFHHLENVLQQLQEVREEIKDWDVILFAVYYHDIIYNIYKKDNELKSARLAQERLKNLSIAPSRILQCYHQIIATKDHKKSQDGDINFLVDSDLSILGTNEKLYVEYTRQVRKEYAIYPKIIYNLNRKRVLESFLNEPKIYKTDYFYQNYEKQARKNMIEEIKKIK